MKVSRVSEMRAMDRTAIEQFGISPEILMENAGHAAYFALRKEFNIRRKRFLIFCGLGNNGGDGFVLARKIHANGGDVQVMVLGDPAGYQGPAKDNYDILLRLSINLSELNDIQLASKALAECDMVIDAIFGTGLSRDVEGLYRQVIELINATNKPVLSIDIPSGVHGDTGNVMGVAIKADCTVTFGLPKLGNILHPGSKLGGKLFVSHISFPPSLHQSDSLKLAINTPLPLPQLDIEGQRSLFGKALIIGGMWGDLNSTEISTASFLEKEVNHPDSDAIKPASQEGTKTGRDWMMFPRDQSALGKISQIKKDTLLELAEETDMVILGTTWSRQGKTRELVLQWIQQIQKPLFIPGAGILSLNKDMEILRTRQSATILPIHLESMSCITSMPLSEINERKIDLLQETAAHLNSILVLKAEQYLIGFPDQRVFINRRGDTSMSSSELTDAMIWTIAAIFCQGLSLEKAVRLGVFLHSLASDIITQNKGGGAITAKDILDHLPLAVEAYRDIMRKESEEEAISIYQI